MLTLSDAELRVLGVLLEKEMTTPDQYPLTLNAIMLGCNQKSSREPVVNYTASQVETIVESLVGKNLLMEAGGGGRVAKYKQRFCGTAMSQFDMNSAQRACLTIMFLRGAQAPGEIKTRANRLHQFASFDEAEQALESLVAKAPSPWAVKLDKQPGQRDHRYQHLFQAGGADAAMSIELSAEDKHKKIQSLKAQIATLQAEVEELEADLAKQLAG
ncbi:YceH family protein [Paraferrimonas sp. SM1919]|uniref:YceH family protein n=1 Tax=Paraferrimonas sp. SM1919 TaxID=2662263 RepID=UPI0013D66A8F|nr:YceH family protein [Paraferrimonas sp. SM1919]